MDPQIGIILVNIAKGAGYGVLSALIGYFKSGDIDSIEDFELDIFLKTTLMGAIVGGITGGTGLELTEIADDIGEQIGIPGIIVETMMMTALVTLVDSAVKAIIRRLGINKLYYKVKARLFK